MELQNTMKYHITLILLAIFTHTHTQKMPERIYRKNALIYLGFYRKYKLIYSLWKIWKDMENMKLKDNVYMWSPECISQGEKSTC